MGENIKQSTYEQDEDAYHKAWGRLAVAMGGLALAAGSIYSYSEGSIKGGLGEAAASAMALLGIYLSRPKE